MMLKRISVFILICGFVVGASYTNAQSVSARGSKEYTGKGQAGNSSEMPTELQGVGIDEKIGDHINLNVMVQNEQGQNVPLSTFFQKNKPVMLSPMYFECPGLCSFHFNGVIDALKKVDWNPGEKFEVIALSFDVKENNQPELAAKKKASYLKVYGRSGTDNGFHFLTADQAVIDELMKQVGFRFRWNENANEWSHASAAILISPEGKITRYLHGVEFDPRDLKFALNETAHGKVGNLVDSVLLYCFKYDQHQSKYGLQIFRVMQLGGAAMVVILMIWLIPFLYRSRREKV